MKPIIAFAVAALIWETALAQTSAPPQPGAAATPGQSSENRSDPGTTTPSTVDRAPSPGIGNSAAKESGDSDMSAASERRPKVGREARIGGVSAGSIVQSPAGEPIGRVRDIVPDAATGDPAYVVITTRSGTTAVPYAVVGPLVQNGHVVLDRSKLDSAPRVKEEQLREKDGASWRKEADRYWEPRKPQSLS
jgi:hypothetical protein